MHNTVLLDYMLLLHMLLLLKNLAIISTTLYSDGTTHSKQHRSKRVKPNGSPCANNHCSTRYEEIFRHNKHTHLLESCYRPKLQAQSLSPSQTTSRDAKLTQHI